MSPAAALPAHTQPPRVAGQKLPPSATSGHSHTPTAWYATCQAAGRRCCSRSCGRAGKRSRCWESSAPEFAYVLNYQIITSEGATVASTVTYLLPVVAIVLGETITGAILAGIALFLTGVALTRRTPDTHKAAPTGPPLAAYVRSPGAQNCYQPWRLPGRELNLYPARGW